MNAFPARILELTSALAAIMLLSTSVAAADQHGSGPTVESSESAAEEAIREQADSIAGLPDSETVSEGEESVEEFAESDAVDDSIEEPGYEEDTADKDIEELTITGQAGQGSTQSMAEAITTFDQGELDIMGVADVNSLALNVPALHVGQFGDRAVITLRGVGAENLSTVGEPGISFHVDGVPMARPSAANADFFDLERVDILRGPQGVEGGRQSNGGRIATRSKPPSEEFDLFGDFQYGAYDQFLFRGVVNVPILDERLMSRASFTYQRRDGYQENLFTNVVNDAYGDANNLNTRLQLRSLLFDDAVDLRLIGVYSHQKGNGPDRHLLGPPSSRAWQAWGQAAPPGMGDGSRDMEPFRRDCDPDPWSRNEITIPDELGPGILCAGSNPRETYADLQGRQDNSQAGVTAHAGWQLPYAAQNAFFSDLELKMIGGWHRTVQDSIFDADATNSPASFFDRFSVAEQGSVEIFVERADVERLDYKVGFFYLSEDVDTHFCYDAISTLSVGDIQADQHLENRSLAGYARAGYRLVDEFRVKAGLRYSVEDKRAVQLNEQYNDNEGRDPDKRDGCGTAFLRFVNAKDLDGLPRGIDFKDNFPSVDMQSGSWSKLTPDIGFDWEAADSSTVSFSYSKGFKPGGFPLGFDPNVPLALTGNYDEELVDEYELTLKNVLFDDRLTLNLTLFWMDYDPFQICQLAGTLYFCRSDGDALSRGIELEMNAEPIDGLRLNGHFNFLDARAREFFIIDPTSRDSAGRPLPNNRPVNVQGNFLPKAPQFAGSFGIQYEISAGRWGSFTPRFQVQSQSRTYFRVFNKEIFSQAPFAKLDLSLDWLSEDGRFGIYAFVNNVTDVDILNFLFVGPSGLGGPVAGQYLPPRTWGIRFSINTASDFF